MIVCLCLHVHMHHTCDLFMLSGGCCNTEAEGYIIIYSRLEVTAVIVGLVLYKQT